MATSTNQPPLGSPDTPGQKASGGLTRRHVLAGAAVATAASMALPRPTHASEGAATKNNRIKQSVCKWCFGDTPMETLAAHGAHIGLKSIELVGPDSWPTLKKHGLICAMTPSHGITDGLNRKENHEECLTRIRRGIEASAEAGFPNVICFSGIRNGMDDAEGLKNCVHAIKQVVALAEEKNVNLCMELLNSKRTHPDYMCDRTHWGVELVKAVGSPRFRLLYDIYHMQVQEGDVIDTIRENHQYIAHYHTAGVPGRHEMDENQELWYPAVVRAIIDTGYTGYLGQEFIPTRDPLPALTQAVLMCDV